VIILFGIFSIVVQSFTVKVHAIVPDNILTFYGIVAAIMRPRGRSLVSQRWFLKMP